MIIPLHIHFLNFMANYIFVASQDAFFLTYRITFFTKKHGTKSSMCHAVPDRHLGGICKNTMLTSVHPVTHIYVFNHVKSTLTLAAN